MPSYPELADKVAILSGAAGNLGRVVATRLHAEGCRLALIDRDHAALEAAAAAIELRPDAPELGAVDLTRRDQIEAFVSLVTERLDPPNIAVNIAGAFIPTGPAHETDEAVWDRLMQINAKTAFVLSAAVARRMIQAGRGGRIINVAARAGLAGGAGLAAYSASKAAVLRLTESMAAELTDHGITVNAVMPSTIDTPQNRAAMPDAEFARWVSPESIAGVIVFLASDAARDISGAGIPVYGRA